MSTTASDHESTVKAIVCQKYGSPDVLELQDVDKPVAKDDEVLVRVKAASVNPVDWRLMRGLPYVLRITEELTGTKRKIGGVNLTGQVEAVGSRITQFQPGDEVSGMGGGAQPGTIVA